MGFHWSRDHLYLAEPLDHLEHRIREQQDPYPGVSSLDEARRERHLDYQPAPATIRPLPGRRAHAAPTPVPGRLGPDTVRELAGEPARGPGTRNTPDDDLPPAA